MWVDDAETDPNLKGFTRDNIGGNKAVNAALAAISIPSILLKDASTSTAPADIVLQAGHHFMVVANDKLVLDHIFTPGPADQNPPSSTPAPGAPASTVV